MKGSNFFKRLTALFITMILLFSVLLTSCSKTTDKGGDEQKTSTGTIDETNQEVQKEPGVVSIFWFDSGYAAKNYDQDLPVIKEIEKNLNIKFDWQLMPYNGYEDALNIKLAAGSDMPDLFCSWAQSPEELAKNGAIVALSDYFDTTMKKAKEAIEANKDLKAAVTSPDGNVYFLPGYVEQNSSFDQVWMIRQDWLDHLGLQVPETTDDFYNVLKAFKNGDPNQNGKKDEIPLYFAYLNYAWFFTMQNFGLNMAAPWDWVTRENDGKLSTYITQPQFKETITYVSKLYKDGLINQDILNIAGDDYTKAIYDNRVGCIFGDPSPSWIDKIKESHPNKDPKWTIMLPPKGPRGERGVRVFGSFDGTFFVSKNGKNTEDATRFYEYIFADPEGIKLINYGIKGMSYEEEGGVPKFTEFVTKNPDGLSAGDALLSIGAKGTFPGPRGSDVVLKELAFEGQDWITKGLGLYADNLTKIPEVRFRFTSDETTQMADLKANLESYINETLAKMLVGNMSIDEFDKFVNTCKDNGIEKVVDIYNQVADRSK